MRARGRRVVVAAVTPWFDAMNGPAELALFKSLTSFGCRVKVIVPSLGSKEIKNGLFCAIALGVRRNIPVLTLLSLYRDTLRAILRERCSTLIFEFPMLPLYVICKMLLGSTGICLIRSNPVQWKGLKGWHRFVHFRLSLILGRPFVHKFTAISPFEACMFTRLGGIPRQKITVIPSTLGEQFERYQSPMDQDEFRSRLGYSTLVGRKVVLYHGVLNEQRGIMRLLELFTESFEDDDKIVLLVVGDGPSKSKVEAFIRRAGRGNLLLWGRVSYSTMPEIIACCDVGLAWLPDTPWWRYQCPTKLVELLALGKPVIASDLPGIRWVAGDSPLVVYLTKLDVDTFKKALETATANKDGFMYSEQLRQGIIDRFSGKSIARQLCQFIH